MASSRDGDIPMDATYACVEEAVRQLNLENGNLRAELRRLEEENEELKGDVQEKGEAVVRLQVAVEQLERTMEEEEEGKALCYKDLEIVKKKMDFLVERMGHLQSEADRYKKLADAGLEWVKKGKKGYADCQRVFALAKEKMDTLQASLSEKEAELVRIGETCSTLTGENESLVNKLRTVLEEENQLKEQLAKSREYSEATLLKLEDVSKELAEVGSRLLASQSIGNELNDLLEKKEKEISACLGREKHLTSEIQLLRTTLDSSEASEVELKKELSEKLAENEQMKNDLEELSQKIHNLELAQSDLIEALQRKTQENEALAEHQKETEDRIEEKQALLNQSMETCSKLQCENKELQEEIAAYLKKQEDLVSEATLLQNNLEKATASESQLNLELRQILAGNEKLKTDLEAAVQKMQDLEISHSELNQNFQVKDQENEALLKRQEEMKAEICKLQERCSLDSTESAAKIDALEKEKDDLVLRVSSLTEELDELQRKTSVANAEQMEQHDAAVQELTAQLQSLQETISSLEISQSNLLEGIAGLKTEAENAASRESKLKEELDQYEMKYMALVAVQNLAHEELQQKIEGKERELEEAKASLSNILKELNQLQQDNSVQLNELEDVKGRLEALQMEKEDLVRKESSADKELSQLKSEISSLEDLLGQAQARLKKELEEHQLNVTKLQVPLQEVQEQLRKSQNLVAAKQQELDEANRSNARKEDEVEELQDQIKRLKTENEKYRHDLYDMAAGAAAQTGTQSNQPRQPTPKKDLQQPKNVTKLKAVEAAMATPSSRLSTKAKRTDGKSTGLSPRPKAVKEAIAPKVLLDDTFNFSDFEVDSARASTPIRTVVTPPEDQIGASRTSTSKQNPKVDPKKIYAPVRKFFPNRQPPQ